MIYKTSVKTKIGWVSAFEENKKIFRVSFGKVKKKNKTKILSEFKKKLLNYFNKKTSDIIIKSEIKGNLIQKKVWNELKNIKKGETKTYGEIAEKFNLSPRHVGKICGQNKLLLLVPCHRVVRSNGELGGFTSIGGVKLKKKLLEFEKL